MAVELILLDNIKGLGQIGDQVKVADGYARNYLLPKDKAAPMTPGVMRSLEKRKLELQKLAEENLAIAKTLAAKITGTELTIEARASEDGKLYGSVSAQQIAEELAKLDLMIDRQDVLLAEPIRELGVYDVEIHVHAELKASVKVQVVGED
jgi:large subunit ribosomal protein L9